MARVEQEGFELVPVGAPERLRPFLEASQGSVWTVSWDESGERSALLRVDPADESVTARWDLRGRATALTRDASVIWVGLTRPGTDRSHHFLVRCDSATDGPAREIEIPVAPANALITNGVLFTTAPLHSPAPPGYSTRITRVDTTTGAGLGETKLPLPVKAIARAADGVMALLDGKDGRATIAILSDAGEITA
jgi:hypothetical protein